MGTFVSRIIQPRQNGNNLNFPEELNPDLRELPEENGRNIGTPPPFLNPDLRELPEENCESIGTHPPYDKQGASYGNIPKSRKDTAVCEQCGKTLSSMGMKRHLTNVHMKKQCIECGKLLSSPYNLKRHVSLVHKNNTGAFTKFACIICFKKFCTEAALSRHVINHKRGKRISHLAASIKLNQSLFEDTLSRVIVG